jgi:hypothetical protein
MITKLICVQTYVVVYIKGFLSYILSVKLMEKVCDECSEKLKDNAELAIHLREQHQKRFCGVCKDEFSNQEELVKHVKNTHGITLPVGNR